MKIRWKIFFLLSSLIAMILFGILVLNSLYLEKFYIGRQREKLLNLGRVMMNPLYEIDIQNIEMNSNVSVSLKKVDKLYELEKTSMMSREQIENIKEQLDSGVMAFRKEILFDYRGKTLMLFVPYSEEGMYIEILSPLNFLEEGIDISTGYYLQVIGIAFIIGCLIAYIFSNKMSTPLYEIIDIAERISKFDFSKRFNNTKKKDEIGELGNMINKMAIILESNINEIKEKNAILEKDIEREKRLDDFRKEFIASVSHELKTPIAIVQGYAQGLLENVMNKEDIQFYCETIIEESYAMNELVQELLLVSQMESKYFTIVLEQVDYYMAIKEFIKRYSREDKKILYTGPKSILVYCEERYIDRVMDNFIVNAVKYSTPSSDIKINVEEKEDVYVLAVSNETDLLNENDLEDIWTPFFRKDKARNREGHGLGLSIVKGILDNHKCEYGVNLVDKWVTFWFTLSKREFKVKD